MSDGIVNLSPPWYGYRRKGKALFGADPDITVNDLLTSGTGQYAFSLVVKNGEKARAIGSLLILPVTLGNITLRIQALDARNRAVTPAKQDDVIALVKAAFTGNPVFSAVKTVELPGATYTYCVFKKRVLRFWNDNLASAYGIDSLLAEDIAPVVLHTRTCLNYCTEKE
jgi:hypothetical protein